MKRFGILGALLFASLAASIGCRHYPYGGGCPGGACGVGHGGYTQPAPQAAPQGSGFSRTAPATRGPATPALPGGSGSR